VLYLQNFDHWGEAGVFDADTGTFEVVPRETLQAKALPLHGHYSTLSGNLVMFFRDDDELYVAIGPRRWRAIRSTVCWKKQGSWSVFSVGVPGSDQLSLTYEPEPMIDNDPTPFIEAEDFDFGLFIINVVNNQQRYETMYYGRFE
jgi:hypothetical protein